VLGGGGRPPWLWWGGGGVGVGGGGWGAGGGWAGGGGGVFVFVVLSINLFLSSLTVWARWVEQTKYIIKKGNRGIRQQII
jgi:hypothetical protein